MINYTHRTFAPSIIQLSNNEWEAEQAPFLADYYGRAVDDVYELLHEGEALYGLDEPDMTETIH